MATIERQCERFNCDCRDVAAQCRSRSIWMALPKRRWALLWNRQQTPQQQHQQHHQQQQQSKSTKQKELNHASLDLTRFRFVVSATETTPGMIISSNVPLHTTAVGTANVLEMWQVPDVMTVRLHAWSAGSEDKPTVIDYACPLLHMLPVIRRRFASQLAPGNAPVICDELAAGADDAAPSSPPHSPRNHSPPPPSAAASHRRRHRRRRQVPPMALVQ
jgi:hypothetical protein